MEKIVIVKHFSCEATYKLTQDKSGAYIARLIEYNDPSCTRPPETLILEKGLPFWFDPEDESEHIIGGLDHAVGIIRKYD